MRDPAIYQRYLTPVATLFLVQAQDDTHQLLTTLFQQCQGVTQLIIIVESPLKLTMLLEQSDLKDAAHCVCLLDDDSL